MIRLDQFAGQIVVLDFFAYWCGPCLRSSPILEREIEQYYMAQGGNPQGQAVRVVSVNIDQSQPGRTERFIRQTGASFVVEDVAGATLRAYGADAIPFLVIIDASASPPEIVYRQAGFEGAAVLRRVIDPIGDSSPQEQSELAELPKALLQQGRHDLTMAGDVLWSSDIQLSEATLTYQQEGGVWSSRFDFSYQTYAEDYEPFPAFDALGFSEHLGERTYVGQAEFGYKLNNGWRLLGTGGGYSGFTDYRSVWLANYYRQQFSFVPGYEEPNPQGYNFGGGAAWEYWAGGGSLEARVNYFHDEVAPGYEIDVSGPFFQLVRGRDQLDSWSGYLGAENVLSARVRTLLEVWVTHTTDRELRVGFQGSWNVAFLEQGVWRGQGGYTHENPQFRAWFAGSTVEWELNPSWYVLVSGRYYSDTGEITNGSLLSTAAPGLEAWQVGAGVRFVRPRWALKLMVGPYWTRYEELDIGTRPFTNLYRNRDWILAQGAIEVHF